MPYDPVAQSGSWFSRGAPQTDEQGRQYTTDSRGQRSYLSPRAVDPYSTDTGPYKPGLLGGGSVFNSRTGQYDKKSNTLEKLTLAGALTPFAAFAAPGLFGGGGPSATMTGPVSGGPAGSGTLAATRGAQAGFSLTPGGNMGGGGLFEGLRGLGDVVNNMSYMRGQGRHQEAQDQLTYDLARQRAERLAQGDLAQADILGTMHPPTDPRAQKLFDGGTISPETIAAMRSSAQSRLAGGGLTPLPKSGKVDSTLNALGMASNLGGVAGKAGWLRHIPGLGRLF